MMKLTKESVTPYDKKSFIALYYGQKVFLWNEENSIGRQIVKVESQIEDYYNFGDLLYICCGKFYYLVA